MLLKGKIALITGSTHNIGLAIARAFAREGAKVIVHSRHQAGGGVIETSLAEWNRIISINLTGYFLCVQHAGKRARRGRDHQYFSGFRQALQPWRRRLFGVERRDQFTNQAGGR